MPRVPVDDMQLDVTDQEQDWASTAVAVAQDITAALQNNSALQPGATIFEDLCRSATEAWEAAAEVDPSSIPRNSLPCLTQLTGSTVQLASALFCQPDVATHLLAAGTYGCLVEQLKAAVKGLTSHLEKCLEVAIAGTASAGPAEEAQRAATAFLQAVLQAVQAAMEPLLYIALTLVAFVARTATPAVSCSDIPQQMRSMAILSLAWTNLTKLLIAVPADARSFVLQPDGVLQAFQCALQQLQCAVRDMPQQPPEKAGVVARFWMQNMSRLHNSITGDDALSAALGTLLEVTREVYQHGNFPEDAYLGVQDILISVLQPRLIACVASLLSMSPANESSLQHKLDLLTAGSNNAAHDSASSEQGTAQQPQRTLQLQVHLLVVLDLMQQLAASDHVPLELIQQASSKLLGWAIQTCGSRLCAPVLSQEVGGALMQHALQACLGFVVGCMAVLAEQQQQELIAFITQMALSQHPLLAFLAQQLLADVLCCSTSDMAEVQLSGLMQLLEATAACAAVPGADVAYCSGARALVDTMVAVLQAGDQDTAANWVSQHLLQMPKSPSTDGDSNNTSSPSSSGWIDASQCSLLVCQCSALVRLEQIAWQSSTQKQHTSFIEDNLSQLWLTAQQVLELLGPQQQQQAGQGAAADAASEQLLVLHQLAWQMEAMAALMQLQAARAQAMPKQDGHTAVPTSNNAQCCTAFAIDLLKIVNSKAASKADINAASKSQQDSSHAAVQSACTAAALKVLAAAGHVAVQEGADELLQVLQSIAAKHEDVHAIMATVVGNIGVPPGKDKHEELFHTLLSSPHWSVRHAAFDALLARLRHNSYSGSGIVRLLPKSMRASATEAAPAVIQTVKAHLHRSPDAQAQQAFESCYQQLAEQYSNVLLSTVNNSTSSNLPNNSVAAALSQLDSMLSCCNADVVAAACQNPANEGAVRSVQTLLQLASGASNSLELLEKALSQAEGDVKLLMAAATAAANGHELGADEVMLVSRQGTQLMGSCASMCSRLRALQDSLACLKS